MLHPFTKLSWEQSSLSEENFRTDFLRFQCTLLREKIFFTTQFITTHNLYGEFPQDQVTNDKLSMYYAPIADLGSWTPFSVPAVCGFALTTYHSQLVLVGGWTDGKKVLNTLWASADGTNWQETLPPMPTSRYGAAVVNTGSSGGPECLVVAGGYSGSTGTGKMSVYEVEVLIDNQWSTVCSIPSTCHNILHHGITHNGTVCYLEGQNKVVYSQLRSLLASRHQTTNTGTVWNTMKCPSAYVLVSFQGHLISFDYRVHVYNPIEQTWVRAEMNRGEEGWCKVDEVVVTPTGQLIMLGCDKPSYILISEANFTGTNILYNHWSLNNHWSVKILLALYCII